MLGQAAGLFTYILAGPHRHVGEAETLGILRISSCDIDENGNAGSSEHLVTSWVAAASRDWAELQGHGRPSPLSRMWKAPNSTFPGLSKLLSGSFGQKQLVLSPNAASHPGRLLYIFSQGISSRALSGISLSSSRVFFCQSWCVFHNLI